MNLLGLLTLGLRIIAESGRLCGFTPHFLRIVETFWFAKTTLFASVSAEASGFY
jgi:hypothetical protein